MLDNIETSKNNSLDRLLFALGIPGIGSKTAKLLAKNYSNIDILMEQDIESLETIKDIGHILATNIVEYFSNNRELIDKLKEIGLNMQSSIQEKKSNELITGKKFVITGTIDGYTRDDLKDIIEAYDGQVSESVSKKTDVVIVGDSPGSKYEKAQKLGIDIWSEDKLNEMID